MAVLKAAIPEQNFERVRNQIAAILTLELAYQFTNFNHDPELNAGVYMERFVPFDVKTDLPAVNVCLAEGDYDNKDEEQSEGTYQYYVDCYSQSGDVKGGVKGDQKSMMQTHKLLGMCRAILENPGYRTLGWDAPVIGRVWVSKVVIAESNQPGDLTNGSHGRLVFNVVVPESAELQEGLPIAGLGTEVRLYETDDGYRWGPAVNGANFIEEDDEDAETPVGYFIAEENTDFMGALVRFSELETAPEVSALSSFVGIVSDGEGGWTNVLFTPEELAAYINAGSTKKRIVVATGGTTLTDSFFETNSITEIVTNNQTYLVDEDFTQDGDTITGVTIAFFTGQVLVAKL